MSIDTSSRDRAVRPILRILFPALAVMVLSGCAAAINSFSDRVPIISARLSCAVTQTGFPDPRFDRFCITSHSLRQIRLLLCRNFTHGRLPFK